MEEIYLKGFLGHREWCSEPVTIHSYFKHYSHVLAPMNSKMSEVEIMQHLVPQSNQLSQGELSDIIHFTQGSQLTLLFEDDGSAKKTEKNTKITKIETGDSIFENVDMPLNKNDGNKRVRQEKNRFAGRKPIVRKEVCVNGALKSGIKDLYAKRDYLISFRVHEPFPHKAGDNLRPGRCSQQICLLGGQSLSMLRDRIVCESDFQDIRGDISQTPDTATTIRAKDEYRSSMFYIENTFYIDKRHKDFVDYSTVLKNWGHGRGIMFGKTKAMEETCMSSLKLRFGYPYLFMHQGNCEHLIIINDARILSDEDSLYSMDYPLMEKVTHHNIHYCMICSRFPAKWIVRENERLVHDPSYMCKHCFMQLNYINGKKTGNFKAYQYWQKGSLL